GELLVYPFFEHYRDGNLEYKPEEYGAAGSVDYRGTYRANEGLLFLGYGLAKDLALEVEAAVIKASFEKSPADLSALPPRLQESGLGTSRASSGGVGARRASIVPSCSAISRPSCPTTGTRS